MVAEDPELVVVSATVPAISILPLMTIFLLEFRARLIVPVSVIFAQPLIVKSLSAVNVSVAVPLVDILLFTVISPSPPEFP